MFSIPTHLNESLKKDTAIVIEIMSSDDMSSVRSDLEKWGYTLAHPEWYENGILENDYFYPLILEINVSVDKNQYIILGPEDYDNVSEEEFYSYNLYSFLDDFYKDTEAIDFVKSKGITTPNYSPRKIIREGKDHNTASEIIVRVDDRDEAMTLFIILHTNGFDYPELSQDISNLTIYPVFFFINLQTYSIFIYHKYSVIEDNEGYKGYIYSTVTYESVFTIKRDLDGITKMLKEKIVIPERPNYNPKKIDRTMESVIELNESMGFNPMDTLYFQKYNTFIMEFNKDVDHNRYERMANALKEIFNFDDSFNINVRGYRQNCHGDDKFIYVVRKYRASFGYSWDRKSDFDSSIDESDRYPKIFTINDVDSKEKIISILERGMVSPTYQPRKMDRTLESMDNNSYRCKTRQEFERDFGENWKTETGWGKWGDMDYLFGKPINDVREEEIKAGGMLIPRKDDPSARWYISMDWLTTEPLKPFYTPKKFIRTLETMRIPKNVLVALDKSPWDLIILRYTTTEGKNRAKKFIDSLGAFNFYVPLSESTRADLYLMIRTKGTTLRKNSVYEVIPSFYDDGSLQRGYPNIVICPTVFNMDNDSEEVEKMFNDEIFKSYPDYHPKKIDRSLDLNEAKNYEYNRAVFVVNNSEESEIAQKSFFRLGYDWRSCHKNILEFDIYPMYFLSSDTRDNRKYVTHFNDREDRRTIEMFIEERNTEEDNMCPTVFSYNQVPHLENILRTGIAGPNYSPRKIIRESVEDYLPFRIWCDDREKSIACEDLLCRMGWRWDTEDNEDNHDRLVLEDESANVETFCNFDKKNKTFDGYDSQNFEGYTVYNYPEDINSINRVLGIAPCYEPRKMVRESMNNKVLWAFDMDDTLVYSTRFEEYVRPLLIREFLTPEIILQNKIDDIGIKLNDLKYEHGRIYFDDPKQKVNISDNPSWVRKGVRVYITQPEAYFLTSESMPIGVHQKIVDIYNSVENKVIVTSRRERLRGQTELALKKLGIEKPNYGLFMYPSDSLVFQSKWKAIKLLELYKKGDFTELHYFDDNMKVLKRIKSYLKKENVNVILYKVNENNYRKV